MFTVKSIHQILLHFLLMIRLTVVVAIKIPIILTSAFLLFLLLLFLLLLFLNIIRFFLSFTDCQSDNHYSE